MGNTIVQGAFSTEHKFLTVTEWKSSGNKMIQAWYWNPTEFVKTIEDEDTVITVYPINRHVPSNEKCWTCGLPVETGEKFCNDTCKKAHSLNVKLD